MGARLIPIVRNFSVSREVFTVGSRDVRDACIGVGPHRLLRFDVLCHNAGDSDLIVGAPGSRPDLFEFSTEDGRYRLRDFAHVALADAAGNQIGEGHKRSFCLIDVERVEPRGRDVPRFSDCNLSQGISAGWADVYPAHLPCQYLVIDDVADGSYQVRVDLDTPRIIAGAPAASATVQIRLEGETVALLGVVPPPSPPPPPPPSPPAPPPTTTPPSPPAPPPTTTSPPRGSPLEAFARDVIDEGDLTAASRYLAAHFVGHGLVAPGRGDHPIDAAAYRSLLGELRAAFTNIHTTFGPRFVERNWIAAAWTRAAIHVGTFRGFRASNRLVRMHGVSIARVEHGRLAEQWDVVDASWLPRIGSTRISALEPPG